ncbi:hypothetical protein RND81_05G234000 [Saponaria officinalis]|uniref:Serine-threonine/tyrosine-protein kinase catalytic domain-containing protein n=1 Tax=Saponaria officinalis TaxID=3572 RepID=A0AAW1L185_SAPOF
MPALSLLMIFPTNIDVQVLFLHLGITWPHHMYQFMLLAPLSDVFSFRIILWELMTVSIPWSSLNALWVVGVVGFMGRRLDILETFDPCISSIIKDSWQSCTQLKSQTTLHHSAYFLGSSSC